MKKKATLCLALSLALLLFAAGCSRDDDKTTGTNNDAAPNAPSDSTDENTGSDSDAAQPGVQQLAGQADGQDHAEFKDKAHEIPPCQTAFIVAQGAGADKNKKDGLRRLAVRQTDR